MNVKMSARGHFIFKISAIERLRIRTDGDGIRTLVLLRGCPLRCRYCINPFSWKEGKGYREYTAQALCDKVCLERVYFMATGGGITFGGGEPLLQSEQIMEFYSLCRDEFNLYAETSLHVPRENVEIAAKCVDQFCVDVKTLDGDIYRKYTGGDLKLVLENLKYLLNRVGPNRVLVRIPLIPEYTGEEEQKRDKAYLENLGVTRFDLFRYKVRTYGK